MVGGPGSGLARSIQTLYDVGSTVGMDDQALLSRYLDGGEGARVAFEAIVARHGATVLQVCRAVAGSTADADDAFQAVFLILACRAAGVRNRKSLGSWLFGVARRTAQRARKQAARRREQERKAAALATTTVSEPLPDDAAAVLIEEVDRLPPRYRDPVVLCHLQGLGYEAAAARLGCPTSTLGVRLKRARERLRTRLERRGVSPTIALPVSTAPKALVEATSRLALLVAPTLGGGVPTSVLVLTRGALRTMKMTRILTATAAFLTMAAGAWAWNATAADDGAASAIALKTRNAGALGKYRLTGRVTDPETGEGVAGATIRIFEAVTREPIETRSGRDGAYVLALPAGDVGTRTLVPPPGYWSPKGSSFYPPMALSDAHPEVKEDFEISRGAIWEFRIARAGNGGPAVKANVVGAPEGGGWLYAVTDDHGTAPLGLPRAGGEADVSVDSPGPLGWTSPRLYVKLRWDDRFDPDATRDVVRLGGNVARYWLTDRQGRAALLEDSRGDAFTPRIEAGRLVVDVALPKPSADVLPDVVGAVVDREGKPISEAVVKLSYIWLRDGGSSWSSSRNGSDRCRVTTDERGRYRLADVPATSDGNRPDAVRLVVSRPGFGPAETGKLAIPAEGPIQVPDVVLGPSCSVVGTVVGPDRKPVVGATVYCSTGLSIDRFATRADEAGRFRLDGLPEGGVGLSASFGELVDGTSLTTGAKGSDPIELRIARPPHLDRPNP